MRKIALLLLLAGCFTQCFLYAKTLIMQERVWENAVSFSLFLQKEGIKYDYQKRLDKEDQETLAEIIAGIKYQVLLDEENNIEQVLIPVTDELQIHIYKDLKGEYDLVFTPILSSPSEQTVYVKTTSNLSSDIAAATGEARIALSVSGAFAGSAQFKYMQPGDHIAFIYRQNIRAGQLFGSLKVLAARVDISKKPQYAFRYTDDYFYNEKAEQLAKSAGFVLPIPGARVSSPFTLGRFHPILKKYRAHLGIDYAAPIGTPIRAAAAGSVIFAGTLGGYGTTLKIAHDGGYVTLYAHLKGFAKGISSGKRVRQGETVAYVGTTGLSTGPHLHFGLYENNKAINPASAIKIVIDVLKGSKKTEFDRFAADWEAKLSRVILDQNKAHRFELIEPFVPINIEGVI